MTAHLILKAGEKRNCGGVEMVFVQMFQSSADQRVEVRNVAENRHKIEAPYVPSLTILAYGRKVAGYDASKLGILIEATK